MKITEPTPGAPCWVELGTSDVAAATVYYREVFGWRAETDPRAEAGGRVFGWSAAVRGPYTQWGIDGADFGGMRLLDERSPDDAPAHWLPYFAVADVDATVARAVESGGMLLGPPTDGPRIAMVRDPQGAVFGIHGAGGEG